MSFNYFKIYSVFFFIMIFISIIYVPIITSSDYINYTINTPIEYFNINPSVFCWPIPGYTRISSYFGKRTTPTGGASSYHQGLDIPAPEGTNLVAPMDSIVTYTGFSGSGGYTIILKNDNIEFVYHHVSPNYIVYIGNTVFKGQIIGYVGPKNVYNVQNNNYKDSNGKPTNGATTRSAPAFYNKKRRQSRQSFRFFYIVKYNKNLHIFIFFIMIMFAFCTTSTAIM